MPAGVNVRRAWRTLERMKRSHVPPKAHWEKVYETKAPDAVSWFAPHLAESLAYIARTGVPKTAAIVDVGGGESTLVDDLLDAGYEDVTVMDISGRALEVCRARLGDRARRATWIEGDVLRHRFAPASVDVWHDRAVFHFLTSPADRDAYVAQVMGALRPGGWCIVGTFGPQGPEECSGLPVARYDAESLHEQFGAPFTLVESHLGVHTTPWGAPQQFVYCFCRRQA
jgi:SAM-dependent methyltransferase